jgi:hypothetical protein
MSGPIEQDELCLINNLGVDNCFTAQFMAVNVVFGNLWLNEFNMSTIGGILGIGYIDSLRNATYANNFWNYVGLDDMQFSVDF